MSIHSPTHDKEEPSSLALANAPPSSDASERSPQLLSLWRAVVVILSLCAGTLLVAINTTIINVAIPSIATDFVAFHDVGWYGSAYIFTVTAFQPAMRSVYKFFNAKWTYLLSIILLKCAYAKKRYISKEKLLIILHQSAPFFALLLPL
jgi:MFS family permease